MKSNYILLSVLIIETLFSAYFMRYRFVKIFENLESKVTACFKKDSFLEDEKDAWYTNTGRIIVHAGGGII